jgi:hypothetical protein
MKNLKAITILTVFFIALSASNLMAQGKPSRSSGARAAYGYPAEDKSKKKKKKKQKAPKRKAKAPINRNKSPWVN